MKRTLLALLACVLVACGDFDDDQAKVRVVNALALYNNLDLLAGDTFKVEDLPYAERSTPVRIGVEDKENEDPDMTASADDSGVSVTGSAALVTSTESSTTTDTGGSTSTTTTTTTVPTGTRTLQVFVDSVATRLIEQAVTMTAKKRYTFYAYQDSTSARLIVEEEDKAKLVAGKMKLRIADMAPASGTLDVYVLGDGQTIDALTPVAAAVTPATVTEYFDIDPGTYDVVLAQAATKTVVLDTGPVELAQGSHMSLIVFDKKNGGRPLRSLLVTD
jgi:hypothetical protein